MSALPINPTDKEVRDFIVLESETGAGALPKLVRAAHQAGVEAERARAAAETTEEWGTQRADQKLNPVPEASEEEARAFIKFSTVIPRDLVRRTAAGPWEVQS